MNKVFQFECVFALDFFFLGWSLLKRRFGIKWQIEKNSAQTNTKWRFKNSQKFTKKNHVQIFFDDHSLQFFFLLGIEESRLLTHFIKQIAKSKISFLSLYYSFLSNLELNFKGVPIKSLIWFSFSWTCEITKRWSDPGLCVRNVR